MSEYVGVASSGPSAAFFDLDRTLISGSSAFTLAIAGRSAGLIPNQEFVRDTFGALSFKLRGASDGTTDEIRDRVLGFVKGKRQDDLVKLNERVLPTLLGKIRPEARRLLDLHRDGGRATYIVSAAPHEIVEPLAHALGMTGGIGTRGQVVDGMYNGALDGPFCYGAGQGRGDPRAGEVGGSRPRPVLRLQRLGQRPADVAGRRPPRRRQPRRPPRTPRPPARLAHRALQPAHQAGDPAHRRRGGHDRDRRGGVRRRGPHRSPAVAGSCRGSRFGDLVRGSGSGE